MQRRKFGNSSLEVSAISLGCWIFGVDWWGHYTDEHALKLMQFSYDRGITFFDNGDAYGNGRAETLLGQFIKQVGRENIEIGGKFGYDFYSDPGEAGSHRERKQDFSPKFMRHSLEKSLQRLPGLAAVLSKEPSRRRIILSITPPGVTNGLRVGPETGASLQAAGCELWGIEVAPVGSTVLDRDTIFEDLISRSGGRRATVYGAALLDTVVRQAAELFLSQYLVTYTHPDAKGPLPLRVGVRGLRQGAQIFAPGWTID